MNILRADKNRVLTIIMEPERYPLLHRYFPLLNPSSGNPGYRPDIGSMWPSNTGINIEVNTCISYTYTYVSTWLTYSVINNVNIDDITHRPVSISVHDPNQYSGENPPQRHSTIPSVDVYTNTNTILCCQPLRACQRYPRERMQTIGILVFVYPWLTGAWKRQELI